MNILSRKGKNINLINLWLIYILEHTKYYFSWLLQLLTEGCTLVCIILLPMHILNYDQSEMQRGRQHTGKIYISLYAFNLSLAWSGYTPSVKLTILTGRVCIQTPVPPFLHIANTLQRKLFLHQTTPSQISQSAGRQSRGGQRQTFASEYSHFSRQKWRLS